MKMRTTLAALAVGATVLTGLATAAAPASAGGNGKDAVATLAVAASNPCGSSYYLVGHYPIYQPGTTLVNAHLDIFYNGYRNCAVNNATSRTWGVAMYRRVSIGRSSILAWEQTDAGTYRYYAGPVYTGPSAGQCIDAYAQLGIDGSKGSRRLDNVHCG